MPPISQTSQMIDVNSHWKGPTIAEIARASGVGTATVDRVLNARSSVRESTRSKVLAALTRLGGDLKVRPGGAVRRLAFLCDGGVSYSRALEAALKEHCMGRSDIECVFTAIPTYQVEPIKFAQMIERTAEEADGVVLVAREGLMINRAIRNLVQKRMPLICLTTDLPNSGRTAYVGNDQIAAGATAGYLMGQTAGSRAGKILLVCSASYRVQEEREMGFRRVLRAEFNHLEVVDRVHSNDDSEHSYRSVVKYIAEHGPPVGIYNTAGGNLGIGRALQESELGGKVVFIGHELNSNSRMLMESGVMHFSIGHDVEREVALSIEYILAVLDKRPPPALSPTRVRIYTKYSCQ
ncbi:MAG: LacI family DNA-binding transcriptional regulator [Hyphomicrobiales bacterium]|nr:LacI family DNA-binding transcriptional regulator [Hyphomicrobiales bacterium]MDE2115896.1 LacI family DNA-binding transcriptional regulator [Hyphomicrobiales bacterium]